MLKEDGQVILMEALSSLEAAVGDLKDGSIEFQMLILIRDHSERFLALCALCEQIIKEGSEKFLRQLLHRRMTELTAFEEERKEVSSFISMCSLIKKGSECFTLALCFLLFLLD